MLRQFMRRLLLAFGLRSSKIGFFNKCLFLINVEKDPIFVQIGANNGISFDDFYQFSTAQELRGIVVEPIHSYFNDLQAAYRYYPKVFPVNTALHPANKQLTMYYVTPETATQRWQIGSASQSMQHVLKAGVPAEHVIEEIVPAMTFQELYDCYVAPEKIDIVLIDTEGADYSILKMIDLPTLAPVIIRFEHVFMSPPQLEEIKDLLRKLDYEFYLTGIDAVAVKRKFFSHWKYMKACLCATYNNIVW